jgi:hypothetical protein
MIATAHPNIPSAAASAQAPASRPLELLEARQLRDSLKTLLRTEQSAMADFLVALAGFDLRRGWEPLGHASFFAFLHFELGLSNSAAFYRMSAARLLQRIPELVGPIGSGQLCLSTTAELAKVVTEENWTEVAPRFIGRSAREAREVVAELQPRAAPPLRAVVTSLPPPFPTLGLPQATRTERPATLPGQPICSLSSAPDTDSRLLLTSEEEMTHPARAAVPRDEVEPITAELRRVHMTVSRQFTSKLEAARRGLGHSIRNATIEQALEAALDLLLEKQARPRGQVKKPRATLTAAAPRVETRSISSTPQMGNPTQPPEESAPPLALVLTEPPSPRRTGPRETISAAVRRAVWVRDQGRCSWPLDGGGCCGSTHLLELDHIHPWARDGETTVANLRLVCHVHNTLAARWAFGARCVERYAR